MLPHAPVSPPRNLAELTLFPLLPSALATAPSRPPAPVLPLAAASAAFDAVFAVFALAMVVLIVVTLRWAIRRDRKGREAWARRMAEGRDPDPPPSPNGRSAPAGRGGIEGSRRPGRPRPGAPAG
ncbi:MAG TPA: hypothetical protein VKV36_12140 [Acidimicrobiales bacterium]|nr:hypothetical protein [Acidimicrobiales bacterium]